MTAEVHKLSTADVAARGSAVRSFLGIADHERSTLAVDSNTRRASLYLRGMDKRLWLLAENEFAPNQTEVTLKFLYERKPQVLLVALPPPHLAPHLRTLATQEDYEEYLQAIEKQRGRFRFGEQERLVFARNGQLKQASFLQSMIYQAWAINRSVSSPENYIRTELVRPSPAEECKMLSRRLSTDEVVNTFELLRDLLFMERINWMLDLESFNGCPKCFPRKVEHVPRGLLELSEHRDFD